MDVSQAINETERDVHQAPLQLWRWRPIERQVERDGKFVATDCPLCFLGGLLFLLLPQWSVIFEQKDAKSASPA
jgi:hypothetical protein